MSFIEKHEYVDCRDGIYYRRYDISLFVEDPYEEEVTYGLVNDSLVNAINRLFQELNEDGELDLTEREEEILEQIRYHIDGYVRHCMLNSDIGLDSR